MNEITSINIVILGMMVWTTIIMLIFVGVTLYGAWKGIEIFNKKYKINEENTTKKKENTDSRVVKIENGKWL